MATSMSVQSMTILQLEYCEKDDGEHTLFLFLDGIVVIMSSKNSLWRMCTNVVTIMFEIVPTLQEKAGQGADWCSFAVTSSVL